MKSLLSALALTTALTLPSLALAQPVTFTTQMKDYGGRGAYLAVYLTDSAGAYAGSLWMSGGNSRYYRDLSGWTAATGGNTADIAGVTGASVGSGRTLTVTLELADTLFDAGYTLHLDAAAEDMRDSPDDVSVALTSAGSGQATAGRRYVAAFTYAR